RKPETETAIYLSLSTTEQDLGLGQLFEMVSAYMRRIEEFSSLGVELYDILGLRETVLTSKQSLKPTSTHRADDLARQEAGRREGGFSAFESIGSSREGISPEPDAMAGEVVFDLSGASATASGKDLLKPGDFHDPRLKGPDADTALVDIVLRHPGYSDHRIGQVLSILLSIEYHRALQLAENAPCVIAWALGQERAQSFKGVIESAGGKVVLVEPGTFGEV
ncbi:MAG: hypothetical protein ACNA8W_18595, partial [Bradymonadaceae bacterium]